MTKGRPRSIGRIQAVDAAVRRANPQQAALFGEGGNFIRCQAVRGRLFMQKTLESLLSFVKPAQSVRRANPEISLRIFEQRGNVGIRQIGRPCVCARLKSVHPIFRADP